MAIFQGLSCLFFGAGLLAVDTEQWLAALRCERIQGQGRVQQG